MVDPLPYATFSFVMSITPGPNNLMLTVSGATFGFRRTLPHMLGICLGCVLQLLAVCAGLGALFQLWPQTQTVLHWVGAAYLLYLGWKLLASRPGHGREAAAPVTLMQALLFQNANPKAWLANITAASAFMPRELGALGGTTYLAGITVLIILPCVAVWALFGTSMSAWLTRPGGRLAFNSLMAAALAATAVMMLL
jgi:threonine/homoserine/homoserine lactone efflux protein